jgi:predicted signal transduction protein with EAL and GGDEF domain
VETVEQLALAATLGCAFAQGYYIARPMPADELWDWVQEWSIGGTPARVPLGSPAVSRGH